MNDEAGKGRGLDSEPTQIRNFYFVSSFCDSEVSSFNPSYIGGIGLNGANIFFIARMDFIFGLKLLLSDTFDILSKHDHMSTFHDVLVLIPTTSH